MKSDLSRSITKIYMTVRAPNFLDPKMWDVRVVCTTERDAYRLVGSSTRGEIVVTPEGSKPWSPQYAYWLTKRPPSGPDDRIVTFSTTVVCRFTPALGKYEIKFVLDGGDYKYAELFELKEFGQFVRVAGKTRKKAKQKVR